MKKKTIYYFEGFVNYKYTTYIQNDNEITFFKTLMDESIISVIINNVGRNTNVYKYYYSGKFLVVSKKFSHVTFYPLFNKLNSVGYELKEIKCIEHYNQALRKLKKEEQNIETESKEVQWVIPF